jgi:hypothetical protein
MRTPNKLQAILIAVSLFLCLHYLLTLGGNYLANNSNNFPILLPWLNLMAYLLYFLSGIIAGLLTKQNFIFVGLVTGVISALSAVLIFGVGGDTFGVFATISAGLVLGGIGGGLLFLYKRKLANAL